MIKNIHPSGTDHFTAVIIGKYLTQSHSKIFHVKRAQKLLVGVGGMLSWKILKSGDFEMLFSAFHGRNLVNLQNSEAYKMPYKIVIMRVGLIWD